LVPQRAEVNEDRDFQALRRLPQRVETFIVEAVPVMRGNDLVPPQPKGRHRSLECCRGVRREWVVVREPDELVRVWPESRGKTLVAAAGHKADAHELMPFHPLRPA